MTSSVIAGILGQDPEPELMELFALSLRDHRRSLSCHSAVPARCRSAPALTMFADNLVPHVLRLDGVLTFAEDLVRRIEQGELIEHGSAEEVEIRADAVHAVEAIVAARADGSCAAGIDELLWNRGQAPAYKARPRHRSRCTAY